MTQTTQPEPTETIIPELWLSNDTNVKITLYYNRKNLIRVTTDTTFLTLPVRTDPTGAKAPEPANSTEPVLKSSAEVKKDVLLNCIRMNRSATKRIKAKSAKKNPGKFCDRPASSLSKLTYAQADEIRMLFAFGGISQNQLARMYGVSNRTVSRIIRNERYVR